MKYLAPLFRQREPKAVKLFLDHGHPKMAFVLSWTGILMTGAVGIIAAFKL